MVMLAVLRGNIILVMFYGVSMRNDLALLGKYVKVDRSFHFNEMFVSCQR